MGIGNGVWEKFGLLSPRFFSRRTGDPRFAGLTRASRFRMALEEQGGLFVAFGCYLAGRADLLPGSHLRQLNRIRISARGAAREVAERELAGRVKGLERIRSFVTGEVFAGAYEERRVIVECVGESSRETLDRESSTLRRSVSRLDDGPEAALGSTRVLAHFREWCDLCGDLHRKRRILENLALGDGKRVSVYPRLIHDLQTDSCLVYEDIAGDALDAELQGSAEKPAKALETWVEALVEQSLLLAVVDAEMQPSCVRLLPGGRVGYRCVPALAPVPVEWTYELVQYLACSVSGNSPRALHMLARMSSNTDAYASEQQLLRQLSALQPELKINEITPATVVALENNWRALAATGLVAPSFLELFHRQWTQIGQYNGDIAPASDLLAETLWPVMGRILRFQLSEVLSAENMREWTASSALLLMNAVRQVGMTLEQVRDNDLSILIDRQEYQGRGRRINRRTFSLVRATMALAVFLVAVRVAAGSPPGMWGAASVLAAVAAAVALSLFVARIE